MKKFRELSGKLVVAMLAVTLLIGCAIGGTVAWLTAKTDAVVNTFTYGDINIDLWETADGLHDAKKIAEQEGYIVKSRDDFKIIPGVDLPKDPRVTVKAGSEACWLFIKVEESGTFVESKVTYSIIMGKDGWTKLTGVSGVDNVYYREVEAIPAEQGAVSYAYPILVGDKVTVSNTLTKEDISKLSSKTASLKFTAYAVQKDAAQTAAAAWAIANPTTNP